MPVQLRGGASPRCPVIRMLGARGVVPGLLAQGRSPSARFTEALARALQTGVPVVPGKKKIEGELTLRDGGDVATACNALVRDSGGGDQVNRALVLYERHGPWWQAVRVHLWSARQLERPTMTLGDTTGATPVLGQRASETQVFGTLVRHPLGLSDEALASSVESLNRLLADSLSIRDLYKKHHWQVSGPTFYALHLMLDKHAGKQTEIVDALAERIQTLGGIALAMSQHVAEITRIEMPPRAKSPQNGVPDTRQPSSPRRTTTSSSDRTSSASGALRASVVLPAPLRPGNTTPTSSWRRPQL